MFAGETLLRHLAMAAAMAGINLSFRLDGLGWLFAMLILGIGMLIVLYAAYYLPTDDRLGRFFALLLAFAGGMLGVVLSENLLLLVVFWEITSLTSFLLIAYRHDDAGCTRSARAWRWPSPAAAAWPCWPACCCSATSPAASN